MLVYPLRFEHGDHSGLAGEFPLCAFSVLCGHNLTQRNDNRFSYSAEVLACSPLRRRSGGLFRHVSDSADLAAVVG